jgi:tol-pal system protein YbgF
MLKWIALVIPVLLLAACGSQPAEPEVVPMAATRPQPVPTDPRVSELQVLLSELIDRMEVMNARLQKLEAEGPPAPTAPRSSPAGASRPSATAAPPGRPAAASAPPAATSRQPLTPARIGDRYREALTLYGKGQIDNARTAFQEVFDADPAGELADNALYWVGETYFATGRLAEAATHYRRVVSDYGDQNKAPDALLRIGVIQARGGDLVLARQTLNQVIGTYPYSTAAASARAELKRIQY